MAKTHNGGGRTSVNTPMRNGTSATGIAPGFAGQLGAALGNHIMQRGPTSYRGEPMQAKGAPINVPLGNEVAGNVGAGGPGAGRTVYATGGQGSHGGRR